ncbi:MAG: hypothetical protein AAF550_10100 [Myxococcota bacterium]
MEQNLLLPGFSPADPLPIGYFVRKKWFRDGMGLQWEGDGTKESLGYNWSEQVFVIVGLRTKNGAKLMKLAPIEDSSASVNDWFDRTQVLEMPGTKLMKLAPIEDSSASVNGWFDRTEVLKIRGNTKHRDSTVVEIY